MNIKDLILQLNIFSHNENVKEVVVLNGDPSCSTKEIQDVYYDTSTKQVVIMVGCH